MERVYSYAVLQAAPDPRRGERVNIGLLAIRPDGLEIQIHDTRKIRSLTGASWDDFISSFSKMIKAIDDPLLTTEQRIKNIEAVQGGIVLSGAGWFTALTEDEFKRQMKEIADEIVIRPRRTRRGDDPSVVAEIASVLRSAEILASRDETLESGKVVRNFEIGGGLAADFAQRNAKLHVAAVLDLRASHPQLAQAALKAVVLDRARSVNEGPVHKIGVYAVAPARYREVRENIELLKSYADDVINWEDRQDREELKRIFYDAFNQHSDHI
jgi:hypothetical protein